MASITADKLEALRAEAFKAREAAEKAWYALFSELPVGNERIWTSGVYESSGATQ